MLPVKNRVRGQMREADLHFHMGKADDAEEEPGKRTQRTSGVRAQALQERFAE
jgi:hypothetical protein